MKICVNGRFLTQRMTGVQRYAVEVVRKWDDMLESHEIDRKQTEIQLISPFLDDRPKLRLAHIPLRMVGNGKGHLWEQTSLPAHCGNSILINLCNTAPLIRKKSIVAIGDASVFAVPYAYTPLFRYGYQFLHRMIGKTVERILTYTEFSKIELIRYCRIPSFKIDVIYLGADHFNTCPSDPDFLSKNDLGKKPFILAVSSMNVQKNFSSIVNAFRFLDKKNLDIVIVGGANEKVFSEFKIDPSENVKWVGYVSDAQLKALYEKAACLVYPSLYEGFGLPPVEAMSCGCPVIVSKSACMPEVCGNAALYCDPYDPSDIAEKIEMFLNKDVQDEYRSLGFLQAEKYTWKKTAWEIWKRIESVVD
jgi:glycosyltransferase involved in cell wall biosynthesis